VVWLPGLAPWFGSLVWLPGLASWFGFKQLIWLSGSASSEWFGWLVRPREVPMLVVQLAGSALRAAGVVTVTS
jgi:hypothetical protein